MPSAGQSETLQTVDRALLLLEAVAEHAPVTSAELARLAGLNRTVVHRLLTTLAARGFVQREGTAYRLGVALVALADRAEPDVRRRAHPVLEALSERFGETAVLAVRDGGDAVAIDQALGRQGPVRIEYAPGFRHPLGKGAHGLALLAFAPEQVRERVLREATDPRRVARAIRHVRDRGWVVTHDELQLGASGLAVPLRDTHGRVVASLGIVAPVGRFPDTAQVATATLAAVEESERSNGGLLPSRR